jgi:hypothetical protein
MMGERTVMQEALFYEFSIERHVPANHLLRSIDRFVDLSGLRRHLKPFYSEIGRPSIDPDLMIRMLIVGYCFGIRSERRLCEEVHLNLAYRWFCRLGLEGDVPSPEAMKAWSQNLGHSDVLTTFTSYGAVPDHRQGELIRALAIGREDPMPVNQEQIAAVEAVLATMKAGAFLRLPTPKPDG